MAIQEGDKIPEATVHHMTDAGPTPKQVTVLGGTSVNPASITKLEVKPTSRACCCNSLRVDSFWHLTTTFFCPSLNHLLKFEESDFLALREQLTAA